MTTPNPPRTADDPLVHAFKNHLSVIVGFSDLLLRELADEDLRRRDILEIRGAAVAALALLPQLASRAQRGPDA